MPTFGETLKAIPLATTLLLGMTACGADTESHPTIPTDGLTDEQHKLEIGRIEIELEAVRKLHAHTEDRIKALEFDLGAHLYELGVRKEVTISPVPISPTTLG